MGFNSGFKGLTKGVNLELSWKAWGKQNKTTVALFGFLADIRTRNFSTTKQQNSYPSGPTYLAREACKVLSLTLTGDLLRKRICSVILLT